MSHPEVQVKRSRRTLDKKHLISRTPVPAHSLLDTTETRENRIRI
jgi:hypothetical protein